MWVLEFPFSLSKRNYLPSIVSSFLGTWEPWLIAWRLDCFLIFPRLLHASAIGSCIKKAAVLYPAEFVRRDLIANLLARTPALIST